LLERTGTEPGRGLHRLLPGEKKRGHQPVVDPAAASEDGADDIAIEARG
jgi:hypothetical protein